jgi:hypothetical protein
VSEPHRWLWYIIDATYQGECCLIRVPLLHTLTHMHQHSANSCPPHFHTPGCVVVAGAPCCVGLRQGAEGGASSALPEQCFQLRRLCVAASGAVPAWGAAVPGRRAQQPAVPCMSSTFPWKYACKDLVIDCCGASLTASLQPSFRLMPNATAHSTVVIWVCLLPLCAACGCRCLSLSWQACAVDPAGVDTKPPTCILACSCLCLE